MAEEDDGLESYEYLVDVHNAISKFKSYLTSKEDYENALKGIAAGTPGFIGDIQTMFPEEWIKNRVPTSEEYGEMLNAPDVESDAFTLGTFLSPLPGEIKAGLTGASAGLASLWAYMKMASDAAPDMLKITRSQAGSASQRAERRGMSVVGSDPKPTTSGVGGLTDKLTNVVEMAPFRQKRALKTISDIDGQINEIDTWIGESSKLFEEATGWKWDAAGQYLTETASGRLTYSNKRLLDSINKAAFRQKVDPEKFLDAITELQLSIKAGLIKNKKLRQMQVNIDKPTTSKK